jgi:uncharacterized protein YeaO (DUF488 family)
MAAVRTKRWNEPAEADDGLRLLVCRYRPRGLPKDRETWDAWRPELAPSKELHADYYGKRGLPISWDVYRARYLREMLAQKQAIADLARQVAQGQTITLLCSSACLRESRCHRSLLKELINHELAKLTTPTDDIA